MKTLAKLLIIPIFILSCKKEISPENPATITLTGKIIEDCVGNPFANKTVELFVDYYGGGFFEPYTPFDEYEMKTDVNGNFKTTFKVKESSYVIELRDPYRSRTFCRVLDGQYNLGTIITQPSIDLQVKTKVNNPYQAGDTILIYDFGNKMLILKLGAPFRDTILPINYKYGRSYASFDIINKGTTSVSQHITIYKGNRRDTSYTELISYYKYDHYNCCTGSTQTLLIEIN